MGLRPEQLNIEQLLKYFVSREEFKRATLLEYLKDLTDGEKTILNINNGGNDYNNYYRFIYNNIKNDIVNGTKDILINDKKLNGLAYYYKSFLLTYPLQYILDKRNISYKEYETAEELWEKIQNSQEYTEESIVVSENNSYNYLTELKGEYYYNSANAIIEVALREILLNRNLTISEGDNFDRLLTEVLYSNPIMNKHVYNNIFLEGDCYYEQDFLDKYAFYKVLDARNIEYNSEMTTLELFALVENSQTEISPDTDLRNDPNLSANGYYDYDFLITYAMLKVLENRNVENLEDKSYQELIYIIESSNPEKVDWVDESFRTLEKDTLQLKSNLYDFLTSTYSKIDNNFFIKKGYSNYLGDNFKLTIPHNAGYQPSGIIIHNIENSQYPNKDIGDVYVEFDKNNIYVYNTGDNRSEFEWTLIFGMDYVSLPKIDKDYLIKIDNFDQLRIDENSYTYNLSEYSDYLKKNEYIIINGSIYSLSDVRINIDETTGYLSIQENLISENNTIYISDIDVSLDINIDDLNNDSNDISILYKLLAKFNLPSYETVIRKINNLEERLAIKFKDGKSYYEIDLSEYGSVDNELLIINGVTYTMFSENFVYDVDTEILKIYDFEIKPDFEIYITAISYDYFENIGNNNFDLVNNDYLNANSSFGEANYSGNNGTICTKIKHNLGRTPSIVSITSTNYEDKLIGNIAYTYDDEYIYVYNSGIAESKFRWFAIYDKESSYSDADLYYSPEFKINDNVVLYNVNLLNNVDQLGSIFHTIDENNLIISSNIETGMIRFSQINKTRIYDEHGKFLEYADFNKSNINGKFDKDPDSLPNGKSILNYSGIFRTTQLVSTTPGNIIHMLPILEDPSKFNHGKLVAYNFISDTYTLYSSDENLTKFAPIGIIDKNPPAILIEDYTTSLPKIPVVINSSICDILVCLSAETEDENGNINTINFDYTLNNFIFDTIHNGIVIPILPKNSEITLSGNSIGRIISPKIQEVNIDINEMTVFTGTTDEITLHNLKFGLVKIKLNIL